MKSIENLNARKVKIQKDIVDTVDSLMMEAMRVKEVHQLGGDCDGAFGLVTFSGRVDRLCSASSELRIALSAFQKEIREGVQP